MIAVVLAGGRGERLKPLTNTLPKPMVKINDKPLLEYTVLLLKKYKVFDIIISVCYHPQKITDYFGEGKKFGVRISYVFENPKKPLGTAGAITKLSDILHDTFLVIYGDSLRDINISKLLAQHDKKNGLATVCIYKNLNPDPKSSIEFDTNKRIVSFVERPQSIGEKGVWSNAGLYVCEPKIFSHMKKGRPNDFGKDVFPKLLEENEKLFVYEQKGYFLDIGNMIKLKRAESDLKEGKFVCS